MLFFFFFYVPATPQIYSLSLHDALPIYSYARRREQRLHGWHARSGSDCEPRACEPRHDEDRKSTRLNSSHLVISYAVFCLKKKRLAHIVKCHVVLQIDVGLDYPEHMRPI